MLDKVLGLCWTVFHDIGLFFPHTPALLYACVKHMADDDLYYCNVYLLIVGSMLK